MGSNRSIRLGAALIGAALLLLVLYLVWNSRRADTSAPVVAGNPNPSGNPGGVTPVAAPTGRRSAVALMDMPARSIITPDMFRMEDVPEDTPVKGLAMDADSQVTGFITSKPIRANRRILTTDLVGHISEVGVAGALSPGTRAMILPIPSKPTFHDLVRVGGFIDVISAFDGEESRTIVENVRVLAVDVFGNGDPPASLAQRGPYKAPRRAIRSGNPAMDQTQPAAAGGERGQTPPAPVPGQPAPGPTPTPTPAPATAAPAPAITIEVTPEQANRISLAQNGGGILDYILVPRPTYIAPVGPGGLPALAAGARVASITRAELAPYANSRKGSGAAKASTTSTTRVASTGNNNGNNSGRSRRGSTDSGPDYGFPRISTDETITVPPADIGGKDSTSTGPAPRQTYEIPIYADGTKVRSDIVLKPQE